MDACVLKVFDHIIDGEYNIYYRMIENGLIKILKIEEKKIMTGEDGRGQMLSLKKIK